MSTVLRLGPDHAPLLTRLGRTGTAERWDHAEGAWLLSVQRIEGPRVATIVQQLAGPPVRPDDVLLRVDSSDATDPELVTWMFTAGGDQPGRLWGASGWLGQPGGTVAAPTGGVRSALGVKDRPRRTAAAAKPESSEATWALARIDGSPESARLAVAELAPADRPTHLVGVFDAYRWLETSDDLQPALTVLMTLVESLYDTLPVLTPDEACTILSRTLHSCGHGGVGEPVELARRSFVGLPDHRFYAALTQYRQVGLRGVRSSEVSTVRSRMVGLEWFDDDARLVGCITDPIRRGYRALDEAERSRWFALLEPFDTSAKRTPPEPFQRRARARLDSMDGQFEHTLAAWMADPPEQPAKLTPGGRHILKTLIWLAGLRPPSPLDDVLQRLRAVRFRDEIASRHIHWALDWWSTARDLA